jgi:hypothetical protein
MTSKEQANELVNKYSELLSIHIFNGVFDIAKHCALIAVDEILEVIIFNKYDDKYWYEEEYWNEVKQEIEKL